MKRITLAIATLLFSAGAWAFHCPADMKKIDEALAKNPKLTAEQMAEVKKYRAEGEALHKAGKHQESVDTLAKAMKILNISVVVLRSAAPPPGGVSFLRFKITCCILRLEFDFRLKPDAPHLSRGTAVTEQRRGLPPGSNVGTQLRARRARLVREQKDAHC